MNQPKLIAGLDEVGMGCLAGPLVICVAAFREDKSRVANVRDSKKMTPASRRKALPEILKHAAFLGLGYASATTINTIGITQSWQRAAAMALRAAPPFDLLIVDGNRSVSGYGGKQKVQSKADVTHWEVSAASVVAKVMRDAHMEEISTYYEDYGWAQNSGYGTPQHNDAILRLGPTQFHRKKWLRKLLGSSN